MAAGQSFKIYDPITFFKLDPATLTQNQRRILAGMVQRNEPPERYHQWFLTEGINTGGGPPGGSAISGGGSTAGGGSAGSSNAIAGGGGLSSNLHAPGAGLETPGQSAGNPLTTTTYAAQTLDNFLSTLAAGGTEAQRTIQDARIGEISRAREQQGKYSKEAALTDANALMSKAISDALRAAAPRISAYSEGAGSSKSSQAALLTQEAATRGAIEGAAEGTRLSTAYGQISNQLSSVLEALTRQDPNSPAALLASTISGSRGIVSPKSPESSSSAKVPTQSANQPLGRVTNLPDYINNFTNPGYSDPYGYLDAVGGGATQQQSGGDSTIVIGPGEDTEGESTFDIVGGDSADAFDYSSVIEDDQYKDIFDAWDV